MYPNNLNPEEHKAILWAWKNHSQSLKKSGLLNDTAEYEFSPDDDIDPWEEKEKEREYLELVSCDCEGPCGYYGCNKPVDIDSIADDLLFPEESQAVMKWYWDYLNRFQHQKPVTVQKEESKE